MVHEAAIAEATGKVSSRNPVASSPEESDGNVVPEKSANKGCTSPAESMEGRAPTERSDGLPLWLPFGSLSSGGQRAANEKGCFDDESL